MNREIKFRGWDGEEILYYNNWFTLDQQVTLCWVNHKNPGYMYVDNNDVDYPNRIELMQYTGLKDRDGKEIREGDLVKDNCGNVGVVKFFDNLYYDHSRGKHSGFFIDNGGFDGELYGAGFDDCVVLGNVYENPELLNFKK